jgi:phosphoribosylpyrophosphate synthetase
MSVNVEIHNAACITIEDIVRSGTTTWRAIHITDQKGQKVSITCYAPMGTETIPMLIGGAEDE